MDILTLAAAKAYTDKKTAEGGNVPSGGGGLTVVELSTPINIAGGSTTLTEDESTALTAAFDSGMPFRIRFDAEGVGYTNIIGYVLTFYNGENKVVAFPFGTTAIMFSLVDGLWISSTG